MSKRKLTKTELEAHKFEHLEFIRSSARSFDSGALGEAKRLAVSIRVLLHQTAASHSILAQLGERSGEWHSTSMAYDSRNLLTHNGLVMIRMTSSDTGGAATFMARLDDRISLRSLSFTDWWDNDIVLKDTEGQTYTRRQLVLYAANKDGGAHVDPELDSSFEALKSGTGAGWLASTSSGSSPIPDVVAHSIRQIAYEVLSHFR